MEWWKLFILLWILVDLLMSIPLWAFWVPLVVLLVLCARCWKRPVIRNVCIVGSTLILLGAIPASVMHLACEPRGDRRLATAFGKVAGPNRIRRYRFHRAGLEITKDYWQLKNVDPNRCLHIVEEHGLEMTSVDESHSLRSRPGAPWWWPKSTKGYSVFEGDTGKRGKAEMWISKDSSRVYLFKFTE